MKTILVLVVLIAMFAVPAVLASPGSNPNGNPAAIANVNIGGDGPGFSDIGALIAACARAGQLGTDFSGLSAIAQGSVDWLPRV